MVRSKSSIAASAVLLAIAISSPSEAFAPLLHQHSTANLPEARTAQHVSLQMSHDEINFSENAGRLMKTAAATLALACTLALPAFGEDELAAKYGGKGFDSSLVDQTCLVDKCSLQAKACLADDPSCRKGLTCTAKCMGDNSCITGCMARYGNEKLDNLLKCTIEDNECIKVAILDGGADKFGEEPRAPAPTVQNFNPRTMEGTWFKVVGYNPNYDCYACQRNTFTAHESSDNPFVATERLDMDVEFSMPHMLTDGSPPPPKNIRETIRQREDGGVFGSQSIGLNDYETHETMIFDDARSPAATLTDLVLGKGTEKEATYSRTAHSEGEMFGLKFWENWYVVGENDPGETEFKFIYYNGKTRQNTYEGAFVYSRSRELAPESMAKVYKIAQDAGMNPDQFCKIRNGCFSDPVIVQPGSGLGSPSNPFRGILASTKISELLGVKPVAAEGFLKETRKPLQIDMKRHWWNEVGDYLENPHRHFRLMDSLRVEMDWPKEITLTVSER